MKASKETIQCLFICQAKSCLKRGAEPLKDRLKELLKNKKNAEVRLIKTKCMDYCKMGPNVILNNQLYYDCKVKDAEKIIEKLND